MEELKYVIEDSTIAELLGVQNFSTDEAAILELVKNRTIARYISELKDKGIIERKGPDNGGKWKIK